VEVSSLTVAAARPGQEALLAGLAAQSFRDAFAAVTPPGDMDRYLAEAFSEANMKYDLADAGTHVFLALDPAGVPAGYAKLTGAASPVPVETPALALERIYLLGRFTGSGYGRALMDHCIGFARGRKMKTLWLGVWQENKRAIAFYERHGFEKYGTKKFTLGGTVNDDYLMKKTL
jgi:ribosomal protein S18 acetylase RimI-like enzyme